MKKHWQRAITGVCWSLLSASIAVAYPGDGIQMQPGEGIFPELIVKEIPSAAGVKAADLNSDGLPDIAVICESKGAGLDGSLLVFTQAADNTFSSPTVYALRNTQSRLTSGDFNGDGRADLLLGGHPSGIFYQNSSGTMDPLSRFPETGVAFTRMGDFNGDGRDDVLWDKSVVLQSASGELNTTIALTIPQFAYVVIGDLNDDLKDEIITVRSSYYAQTPPDPQQSRHTINGIDYVDVLIKERLGWPCIADVNGDDRKDLVIPVGGNRYDARLVVVENITTGDFSPYRTIPVYDIPEVVKAADLTGSGREDLVILHSGWDRLGVLVAKGDSDMHVEELYRVPQANYYNSPDCLDLTDLNRDGRIDAVVVDGNGRLVINYNAGYKAAAVDWHNFQ